VLARDAVVRWARGEPAPLAAVPGAEEPAGAFVSLYRRGELRGCIGHLEADQPLAATVLAMAVAAARDDPRFPPLTSDELDGLVVELSVLSPCRAVRAADVVPGRDGVLVRGNGRQGVLLPQVATAYGWDRDTLLTMVCRKAGLAGGAWRAGYVELFTFEAQVITGDTV
jgi:AmmeMemoRadiSam system protein A